MAKTLEVGGKEEKLFQEQLISGNESLVQVSMAFVTHQHLPTEQHNRLYKGVPELVPGEGCYVVEKQQTWQRRAPLQEEMDTIGNSSLSPGSPYAYQANLPGPCTPIQPYRPHWGIGLCWLEGTTPQPSPTLPSQPNFHFQEQRFHLTKHCANMKRHEQFQGTWRSWLLVAVSMLDSILLVQLE